MILNQDELFLIELSNITAPGAQLRGSLLAAAWLRHQSAFAAVVAKGPPKEYARGQPDPCGKGVPVHEGMPNARTGTVLGSFLSRFRTHIGPPRFHIPDYDNEKMGPKFRGVVGAFPGRATVLSYRLYY